MLSADETENLAKSLDILNVDCETYEFHGVVTALATIFGDQACELWQQLFKLEIDPHDLTMKEQLQQVNVMVKSLVKMLDEDLLSFTPHIPDDDEPIAERIYALASWCQGYLLGLNYKDAEWLKTQSDEFTELMDDLQEIARIESYQYEEGEEDEHSLSDIIEYVRTGIFFVFDTVQTIKEDVEASPTIH